MKRGFRGLAIFLALVLAAVAAAWLGMNGRTIVSQVRLLREFHLPVSLILDVEDYVYWNDFLKYTDGYEMIRIDVGDGKWTTPDGWNVGKVTLYDIVQPSGLGFSAALSDEMESGEIPVICEEWFFSEKRPDDNYDRWEFFVGGYDGDQTLFLYRGHHLYGAADLRITEG